MVQAGCMDRGGIGHRRVDFGGAVVVRVGKCLFNPFNFVDMAQVVRFDTDEDGWIEEESHLWHLVQDSGDAPRAVCSGQVFGKGERGIEFEFKKGAVTCPQCCAIIAFFKRIPKSDIKPC